MKVNVGRCHYPPLLYNKKMVEVRDINDFNDYLESLLARNECDDLELKSAAGGFPRSFYDTYSAFANSDGGTIVLGVQEKRGKFCIDNLSDNTPVKTGITT